MPIGLVIGLLSTGVFTVLAVAIAVRSHQLAQHALRYRSLPSKRLEEIEFQQADLADRLEAALAEFKKQTQRSRMRARRAEEETPAGIAPAPGESVEAWKRRARLAIANGTVDPRKPN